MARGLTTAEARWLAGNCLPQHAVSAAPDWPPGKYFRRVLKGNMRVSGQLETAYLMLEKGKHLCLRIQEPEALEPRFSETVYHGTSLGALEKIMSEGFRPSLGAGSDAVGKKFGCALPMVYTSGLLETAHGYVGNVVNGQRIGSGPMVNCVLWMKADPDGRLFKKRATRNSRGELRNEQQGYHPKDLTITKIYLHCIEAGNTSPQKAKYGDGEPNGWQRRRLNADLRKAAALLFDEQQAPWWKPPPKVIQQKKKEGVPAGLSKANEGVLQRWRKERKGEPASGSGAGCCVDADMPGDDYWIQRWTALVHKVLRWRAPTRRTLSRKRRDAATRAAISADVARFLGVMRAERVLATEQRPGQTRGSEATSGSEG